MKGKRKKKQARKDGGDGFSVDRRKAASAVFPAGAPYLIDLTKRYGETLTSQEKKLKTQNLSLILLISLKPFSSGRLVPAKVVMQRSK